MCVYVDEKYGKYRRLKRIILCAKFLLCGYKNINKVNSDIGIDIHNVF